MGANNIPAAAPNTVIPASDHNSIRTAMIGDHVPRNASANPEDGAGSTGQSAYRWLQGFIKKLFIGNVADNISIEADNSDCIIKVGGVERARIPQSVGLQPAGMIVAYSGTSDPAGWLLCDGREVSRTTYARLWTAIGATYGSGNGTTTFNLPDLRGRFVRGSDNMGTGAAGRDPNAGSRTAMNSGGNTGENVGSIQGDGVGPHGHILTGDNTRSGANQQDPSGNFYTASGDIGGYGGQSQPTDTGSTHSTPTISETRPINANLNYLIKT